MNLNKASARCFGFAVIVACVVDGFNLDSSNANHRPRRNLPGELFHDQLGATLDLPTSQKLMSSDLARLYRRIREQRTHVEVMQPTELVGEENRTMPWTSKSLLAESAAPKSNPTDTQVKKINTIDRSLSYESALEALRAYEAAHGDLVIPRRFLVPDSPEYPSKWHGIDIASTVYNMQWWQTHVKGRQERVAELNKLGFVWGRLQPEWNLVLEGLITYSMLHGDLLVPISFVIPRNSDDWPKETWGISLGRCVYRIRIRSDFLHDHRNAMSRIAQLDGLGFVWDVNEHLFRKFCYALECFNRLERPREKDSGGRAVALRIPSTYVVPSGEDTGWPKELWGYPLGAKCTAVRQKELYVKGNPERMQTLEKLGFHRNGNTALGWLEVVHAAAIYSRMHDRDLNVPVAFVVPSPPDPKDELESAVDLEDWPWPEHLWGFPLGQRLKAVRLRGAYLRGPSGLSRRAQLDALGFNWSPKRGRPRKTKTTAS